jgi:hypothetical protein
VDTSAETNSKRTSVIPDAARPLLEKARPWADPIVDEMRPIINDLRPVIADLRADLADRLPRLATAVTELPGRLDLGSVARIGGLGRAAAERLTSVRPMPRGERPVVLKTRPAPSTRGMTAPRMPSIPIGSFVRAIARRLRPGRWWFRTASIAIIALVLSNATLRDAMVVEINWGNALLRTVEMPTVEMPTLELPTLELPAFELPTIELPAIQIPAFEIPSFQFPTGETATKLVPAQFELPPLSAYRAAFETQAAYPTVPPNATVEWVVALRNTGSVGWYRGVDGAQAALALSDGTEAAVQSTAYVAPGDIGWFIARFRAPASPGTHSIALLPRIDGRGQLPDLGIVAVVTVR